MLWRVPWGSCSKRRTCREPTWLRQVSVCVCVCVCQEPGLVPGGPDHLVAAPTNMRVCVCVCVCVSLVPLLMKEEHNSILREECVELIQKAAWLSVFCSKCRELMRLLRELSKRLRHKLEVSRYVMGAALRRGRCYVVMEGVGCDRCWEREKQAHYRAKPRAGERKGGGALDSPSTVSCVKSV